VSFAPSRTSLDALRARAHPHCVICTPHHPLGLSQTFVARPDGVVQCAFTPGDAFEGYPGLLHGGVAACLLDGAMTNCLFGWGVEALTGELTIRYREPIALHTPLTVRAWLVESRGRLRLTRAELWQQERLKAAACGKFVDRHE